MKKEKKEIEMKSDETEKMECGSVAKEMKTKSCDVDGKGNGNGIVLSTDTK